MIFVSRSNITFFDTRISKSFVQDGVCIYTFQEWLSIISKKKIKSEEVKYR